MQHLKPDSHPQGHPGASRRSPTARAGFWSVGVLFLIVVVWSAYWLIGAGSIRNGVEAWVQDQRARGLAVQLAGYEISGYPLHWRVTFHSPGLGAPKAARPWLVEASQLTAQAALWPPEFIELRATGPYRLRPPGTPSGGSEGAIYHATADQLWGAVQFHQGKILALRAGTRGWTSFGPDDRPWILADQLDIALRAADPAGQTTPVTDAPAQAAQGTLDLQAINLTLPPHLDSPFGDRVEALDTALELRGAISGGPTLSALGAWRDQGGTVEISRARLKHGPLGLEATGTLALDGALQPIGALTARVQGFFDAVDRLVVAGVVRDRDAVMAKVVLGALAKKGTDGTPRINLPLTLQARRLTAGPVPLLTLAPITWSRLLGDHLPAIP